MSLEVFTLRFEVGRRVDANSGDKTKLTYHTKLSIIINIPYRSFFRDVSLSLAYNSKNCLREMHVLFEKNKQNSFQAVMIDIYKKKWHWFFIMILI